MRVGCNTRFKSKGLSLRITKHNLLCVFDRETIKKTLLFVALYNFPINFVAPKYNYYT